MQDRTPRHPGRVKLTPVTGQDNTYDMTRADEPVQEGTPLNKATLLTDETAQAIGLTSEDPTVDEALRRLVDDTNRLELDKFRVGDVRLSNCTGLGDNWLLANGALTWNRYPALTEVSPLVGHASSGISSTVQDLYNGGPTGDMFFERSGTRILHTQTGEVKTYARPAGKSTSAFLGMDWNGTEYIACTTGTSTFILEFYRSTDLQNWTLITTLKLSSYREVQSNSRLMFNGTAYYLCSTENGYVSTAVYKIPLDFSSYTQIDSNSNSSGYTSTRLNRGDDGYFTFNNSIFSPDGEELYNSNASISSTGKVLVRYKENKYLFIPGEQITQIQIFDTTTNTFTTSINVYNIMSRDLSIYYVKFNSEKNVWEFHAYYSSSSVKYIFTLPPNLDTITKDSFTSKAASSAISSYGWNLPTKYWKSMTTNGYITGPDIGKLPSVSVDNTYAYIKVKEDAT